MRDLTKHAVLCPNCHRLVSRDEPRCPYCGTGRPGAWWKNNRLTRALGRPDLLIRGVLYTNIAMFVVSLLLNGRMPGFSANPFHLLSPENRSLFFLGATGTVAIEQYHRYWTILAANYLHGGLLHLGFNMLAFWQLGPLVAREFGTHRTAVIYTLGGALGYWISYRAGVQFTIGASGAVCALIGAILYFGKSRGGAYGQAIYAQIGGWAMGIFLFGFIVPGINNWAHGGGLAGGAALGYFLGYEEKRREGWMHKLLAWVCILLTVAVLVWAVVTGVGLRLSAGR